MEYVSAQTVAQKWGITKRRVNVLCAQGRVVGAIKRGNIWLLPSNCEKPTDARLKKQKEGLYDEIKW